MSKESELEKSICDALEDINESYNPHLEGNDPTWERLKAFAKEWAMKGWKAGDASVGNRDGGLSRIDKLPEAWWTEITGETK